MLTLTEYRGVKLPERYRTFPLRSHDPYFLIVIESAERRVGNLGTVRRDAPANRVVPESARAFSENGNHPDAGAFPSLSLPEIGQKPCPIRKPPRDHPCRIQAIPEGWDRILSSFVSISFK